jgi:hypothetical protein
LPIEDWLAPGGDDHFVRLRGGTLRRRARGYRRAGEAARADG